MESLFLVGNGNLNGTGNSLNNFIRGNNGANRLIGKIGNDVLNAGSGNDTLDGGLGVDRMAGGFGNDLYQVDNPQDFILESPTKVLTKSIVQLVTLYLVMWKIYSSLVMVI